MQRRTILQFLGFFLVARQTPAWAGTGRPGKPGKKDRCPVCGMFVYKYPKWVAAITFKDGTRFYYDGVKDMLKHYFDVQKYSPGKSQQDITAMYVTDYYSTDLIDARGAFYVRGSDVLGPMGHELIPFRDQASAQEFLTDHRGKTMLRFEEITSDLPQQLDRRQ